MNIYFISSYVCVKPFLSHFKSNESNIIVLRDVSRDLIKFFDEVIKTKNTTIYIIKDLTLKNYLFFRIQQDLRLVKYLKRLSLNHKLNVFIYNSIFILNYPLIISNIKQFSNVNFVNGFKKPLEMSRVASTYLKFKRIIIRFYNLLYRLNLDYVKIELHKAVIIWNHNFKIYDFKELTWDEINLKFNNNILKEIKEIENQIEYNILYIHTPNDNRNNYNYNESIKKVMTYLSNLNKKGFKIYLKNHPDHNFELNCDLFDCDFLYELPRYYPVEIYSNCFSKVYTFKSIGINAFFENASCYSLLNLYVFNSNKNTYKKYIDKFLTKQIKFLKA
jgi:hypothetical protein